MAFRRQDGAYRLEQDEERYEGFMRDDYMPGNDEGGGGGKKTGHDG